MEENKLNIDKIVSKINKETTVEELIKEGVPEETAQLLVKVYEKGVGEYRWKHYALNEKHRDVCVKVCEKLL